MSQIKTVRLSGTTVVCSRRAARAPDNRVAPTWQTDASGPTRKQPDLAPIYGFDRREIIVRSNENQLAHAAKRHG